MANTLIKNLLDKGELPEVNVEISLSKETIVDLAAAAVIVAIVIAILNKYILQKL